jgi:hypothetical protein
VGNLGKKVLELDEKKLFGIVVSFGSATMIVNPKFGRIVQQ